MTDSPLPPADDATLVEELLRAKLNTVQPDAGFENTLRLRMIERAHLAAGRTWMRGITRFIVAPHAWTAVVCTLVVLTSGVASGYAYFSPYVQPGTPLYSLRQLLRGNRPVPPASSSAASASSPVSAASSAVHIEGDASAPASSMSVGSRVVSSLEGALNAPAEDNLRGKFSSTLAPAIGDEPLPTAAENVISSFMSVPASVMPAIPLLKIREQEDSPASVAPEAHAPRVSLSIQHITPSIAAVPAAILLRLTNEGDETPPLTVSASWDDTSLPLINVPPLHAHQTYMVLVTLPASDDDVPHSFRVTVSADGYAEGIARLERRIDARYSPSDDDDNKETDTDKDSERESGKED